MGYTCADMGDIDRALEICEYLKGKSPQLSDLLNRYIYKVDPPKIMFAHADGTFPGSLPRGTAVSSLDPSLAGAGASRIFTVRLQFDKEMDRTSVETVTNWQIGRASGTGPARYNYGLAVPSTEVQLPGLPDYVSYDPVNFTATVFFHHHAERHGRRHHRPRPRPVHLPGNRPLRSEDGPREGPVHGILRGLLGAKRPSGIGKRNGDR